MPWYHIHVDCGGGHQSHVDGYIWEDRALTEEQRRYAFEQFVDDRGLSNALGDVKRVRALPKKARQEKISDYRSSINWAKKMLKILKARP